MLWASLGSTYIYQRDGDLT